MKNLLPLFLGLLILSSCKKQVGTIPVESVTIDKGPATNVHMGTTLQLTATVLPENATSREVSWDSSDPSIAIVAGGLVTPAKEGEVTISATAGGVTANCKVTVRPPVVAVTGISLAPVTVNVVITKTSTLTATFAPENASDQTVVWTSDQENIATVSGGVVTGVALGTCTITAKSAGDPTKTATCAVTVVAEEIPITGISIDPETANIMLNETRQLSAIIAPETATNKNVTWATSNAAVAEVSTAGLVTAKSLGTATITVAGVADPSKTATCAVTVTNLGVTVTAITAAPADTTLAVSHSFQLRHTIEPATTTNVNVTYESSNAAIATVSGTGWVTAGATGQATITVKSAADATKTSTCQLTIKPRVASITVSPDALDLAVGQKRFLTVTVMPSEAAIKTVIWSSADQSKATVSPAGEVTALAHGTVNIIATSMDGSNITGSAVITVVTGVAGISLNHTVVGIILGETKTLTATIAPAEATNKNVLWISDKENIATVSGGVITARATGTCTITAKSASDPTKMATCAVTVSAQAIPVTGISVTPSTANILVNETRPLTANLLPENATNKDVTWVTSDASIAEVSTAGLVTAKSVGTANITATSVNNSAKSATCAVTVTNQRVAVTGVTVAPADTTIIVGASFELNHNILPVNATNANVTYVPGDAAKATVSTTGLVTAVTAGQTTITVISAADPTKTGTCTVTVTAASVLVQSITVSPDAATVSIGQRQQLTPAVLSVDATNKTVTWSSADPSKATVSNSGEVTAVGAGQVVITATANDGSGITGRATVTVPTRATSLAITPANPTVISGQTLPLSATVLPANAVQTVTWSSGDQNKATINATTGVATGTGAGTVTLTATATDGNNVTGTVTLTVQPPPVSTAAITHLTVRSEDYSISIPNPGPATTLNHAPRSLANSLLSVQIDIIATEGATIKIGTRNFSTGQRVNCVNPVTFTVTEAGKSGSKQYTLTITHYNKATNPYGIYSLVHLHNVRQAMREGYKLMTDLTMPASSAGFAGINDYGTEGWLPISGDNDYFRGILDGAGHKIENLYANRKTLEFVGLFARVGSEGIIKNLGVSTTTEANKGVGGENRTAKQYSGILAGQNYGTIEDCYSTGTVFSSAVYVDIAHAGGLVGAHEGGQVSRCYSTATASGSTTDGASDCYVGGLLGYSSARVTECYATGKVYSFGTTDGSRSQAGGLIGSCLGGPVNRCYATGDVYAQTGSTTENGAFAGGFTGHFNYDHISNCYALGKVSSRSTTNSTVSNVAGGFMGVGSGGSVSNCYAAGEAHADGGNWRSRYIGGFLGYTFATLTNCYRNWDASVKENGSEATPDDKNTTGLTSEYLSVMQTAAFRDKLNQGHATGWGQGGGKNNNLPYLIGVGVGK